MCRGYQGLRKGLETRGRVAPEQNGSRCAHKMEIFLPQRTVIATHPTQQGPEKAKITDMWQKTEESYTREGPTLIFLLTGEPKR